MKSILNVGKDLAAELCITGEPKLLNELFELRTSDWKYWTSFVEGGSEGVFDDLHFAHSGFGFELIPTAVEIVLTQKDIEKFVTALYLLYVCINESETTEIPEKLVINWEIIQARVYESENKDGSLMWDGISRWYRINIVRNY